MTEIAQITLVALFFFALITTLMLIVNFTRNVVALCRARNLSEVIDGHLMNPYLVLTVVILWTLFYMINLLN